MLGMKSLSAPTHHDLAGETLWYHEIRDIHNRHFHDPWQERADTINQRYALPRAHMLLTHGPGVPMPWFNGNIAVVEPGRWVLVISLNHQINPDAHDASARYARAKYTPATYWDHWRTFNTDHWYRDFFGPLAQVAAAALGERLTKEQEPAFATNRMIFVEICPYGSNKFNLPWQAIQELLATDLGFQRAAEVNHLLIEKGRPALVMVNGVKAIDMVEHLYADSLKWQEIHYDSCDLPREGRKPKRLRHYCGSLHISNRTVSVIGFPFLRTPMTHNSNGEVALLANHALACSTNRGR